mmetsp:Transcript_69801/g.137241  ORF Transcript_69801/g.137241 Transcript_69801/m.137241 type:complete len:231 (+) Transcript_69801:72-764(+)
MYSNDEDTNDMTRQTGRWTREEHQAFLAGLRLHGREWKQVAQSIKTRTSSQIRSHAQKYFAKGTKDRAEGTKSDWARSMSATFAALAERRQKLLSQSPHTNQPCTHRHNQSLQPPSDQGIGRKISPSQPEVRSFSDEEMLALSVLAGSTKNRKRRIIPSPPSNFTLRSHANSISIVNIKSEISSKHYDSYSSSYSASPVDKKKTCRGRGDGGGSMGEKASFGSEGPRDGL